MKIDIANTEKLEAALKDAQKRARVHLLKASDIREIASEVDKKLDEANVPKSCRQGITVTIDPYRVCKSYGYYYPKTTVAELKHGKEKWFVTAIERTDCKIIAYGSDREPPEITLPLTRPLAASLVRTLGFIPFWKEG